MDEKFNQKVTVVLKIHIYVDIRKVVNRNFTKDIINHRHVAEKQKKRNNLEGRDLLLLYLYAKSLVLQ